MYRTGGEGGVLRPRSAPSEVGFFLVQNLDHNITYTAEKEFGCMSSAIPQASQLLCRRLFGKLRR